MAKPSRIRKMPHHLRVIKGIHQFQRKIPDHLQEIVAVIIGHKTLSEKEREKGRTRPFVAWYIRSTGTGNEAQAKRIAEGINTQFNDLITRAELWADAPAIAAAINEGRMDEVPFSRINLLGKDKAGIALEMVWSHLKGEYQRAEDINTITARFRAALCGIPANENLSRAETAIAVLTGPEPCKWVDSTEVINAWIGERKQAGRPPKDKAIGNKRSKLARLFGFLAGKTLPDRLNDEQIGKLLASGNVRGITEADLKKYRLVMLDQGTAYDHIVDLKALFAVAKRAGLIDIDPSVELAAGTKQDNPRAPFNDTEAKKILVAARTAEPIIRWGHWIGALSTFIPSEILEAPASEVYRMEEGEFAGQWVFDTRGRPGKTAFRPRITPLHPSLIDEGFLDYHATRKGKQLFDGNTTANTNKLNEFVHGLRIEKTFYSWRHRNTHKLEKLAGGALGRYIAGHAAKDVHEKFYLHYDLPEEFGEIITAINGLKDPTGGHPA
jgi:hypothetical protein